TVALIRDPFWVALPAAVAMVAAVILRHFEARFTRRDIVLVPVLAAVFIALIDATPLGLEQIVPVALAIVLALRIGIAALPSLRKTTAASRFRGLDPSSSFALAPLALVAQTHFLGRNERYLGWPALAIVVLTPVALRLFADGSPRSRVRI